MTHRLLSLIALAVGYVTVAPIYYASYGAAVLHAAVLGGWQDGKKKVRYEISVNKD